MNKFFKPASLLMYILSVLVFFIAGAAYAGLTGKGDNQGLAGGAIVLGYGVMFAFIAILFSLFLAWRTDHRTVLIINRMLGILLVICIAFLVYRVYSKKSSKTASLMLSQFEVKALGDNIGATFFNSFQKDEIPVGMGFFKPDFYNNRILYFYGNPNLEKSVQEHMPVDSIVFKQQEITGFEISYAPPWLVPEYLKLDYDILYFRVQSLSSDFVEVTVNKITQKTIYVDRHAGKFIGWPDFLLSINSVAFIENEKQEIRYKPLSYAGKVNTAHEFMRPIMIKGHWMKVLLLDRNFRKTGEGWIQWIRNDKLLIRYSLLS